MTGFLQSPGVQVVEKDASLIVPGVSSSVGAMAGSFQWGPINDPILINDETQLVSIFGKPDNSTYKSFFNAANFLAYSNGMYVRRVVDSATAKNSSTGVSTLIQSVDDYLDNALATTGLAFTAKFPGALGNSLQVKVVDQDAYTALSPTDKSVWPGAPSTSPYAVSKGKPTVEDELHVMVVDAGGLFTGTPGTVLETFAFVSKASDAISFEGTSNYFVNVIRDRSQYVYVTGIESDWGTTVISQADDVYFGLTSQFVGTLTGGVNGYATDAQIAAAYGVYANADLFDVSLVPTGQMSSANFQIVLNALVGGSARTDVVVFGSITDSTGQPIFNTTSNPVDAATTYLGSMSSSYAVLDSGFKYQYDKYNDVYRWIALNSDTAGLCALTDKTNDPWFSPGGFNRGQVKNAIKLAWNPNQSQRDALYKIGINSVVAFPGQGIVLFGDKTMTQKPSAFDHINIRRLFIAVEKAVSRAAKFQLFEQNDDITRSQFIALVEPFLREVQGRRGIEDFRVICDESNNPPSAIARNEFYGTVLIKPLYSINFIRLTFTAVGPNVSFDVAAGV